MRPRVRCKKGATLAERLALHSVVAPSGCWIWTGARARSGHGRIQLGGATGYAHRVSYEVNVGPIPEGLQLDHLCRRPACINPRHLQPVTARTNMRRGTSPAARAQRRDVCLRGHLYSDHAVQYGCRRYCRECMKGHQLRYKVAARERREQERAARMARLIAYRDRVSA